MNPSYLRVRLSIGETMTRLATWLRGNEIEPPKTVRDLDAVRLACSETGNWRGISLFVYESGGWTIVEDLSGHLGSIKAEHWLEFAGCLSLVFAGYNDSVPYGELIEIDGGRIKREFLHDLTDPQADIRNLLPQSEPLETWIDVARFVDEDMPVSDNGLLWLVLPSEHFKRMHR
jgi:hypothetical protein